MTDPWSFITYSSIIVLMMAGLYIVIASSNLIKKVIGLNIFQASVFILYLALGKIFGASPPIIAAGIVQYSNPLPHVLILTAIVVGVATTAVGLALIIRIKQAYGSIDEQQIVQQNLNEP